MPRRTGIGIAVLLLLASALPVSAEDLPQGAKLGPPEPLPEASCDTSRADAGGWLVGRWVAPYSRWEFSSSSAGLAWRLEQKPDINAAAGWKDGATLTGPVQAVSACSMRLVAGEGGEEAFTFDGILTDDGKIYGFAVNRSGQRKRWVLRRER